MPERSFFSCSQANQRGRYDENDYGEDMIPAFNAQPTPRRSNPLRPRAPAA